MDRKVEDWSTIRLYRERTRISFPEYQREKSLWSKEKKCLLIDSILRDIDIPKLYFNRLKDKSIEVIDGQQRLWSVWEFLDDELVCKIDGDDTNFSNLSAARRKKIENYKFQITVFEEAKDDYLRELFVRLQLGLLLNTGERLNASKGEMKDLVFKKLANHRFIKNVGIPARRYARQTLCAQICINSFMRKKNGSFARTRYDDLLHFFNEYSDPRGKDNTFFAQQSERIREVLNVLWSCFGSKAGELKNRSFILSIYLFVEDAYDRNGPLTSQDGKLFSRFIFQLWKRLREESKLGIDRKNRELYSFQTLLNSAPGEAYQISRRHEKLTEYFRHFEDTGKVKGD